VAVNTNLSKIVSVPVLNSIENACNGAYIWKPKPMMITEGMTLDGWKLPI
jgi:hypothetical protein